MACIDGIDERIQGQLKACRRAAAGDHGAFECRARILALAGYLIFPLAAGLAALSAAFALQLIAGLGVAIQGAVLIAAGIVLAVALPPAIGTAMRLFRPQPPRHASEPLAEQDAPALFGFIEDLRRRTGAPPIDAVYLSEDYNAAVLQRPRRRRWGHLARVPAAPVNELVIGRPLLAALSKSEFAAVVAHELGHLACHHGRIALRFQPLYIAFSRVALAAERRMIWRLIGLPAFARWHARRFMALAFPLYRRAELEADQVAAGAAGAEAVGAAIIRMALAEAKDGLPASAMNAVSEDVLLRDCMGECTGDADTHPCLRERLDALGVRAQLPPPPMATSADLVGAC